MSYFFKSERHDKSNSKNYSRENSGSIKIYGNKTKLDEAIQECCPLSGIVDNNDDVWLAYRPTGIKLGRSCVTLIKVDFDDLKGEYIEGICWMSPIILSDNEICFNTLNECCDYAREFTLLLPQLSDKGNNFVNKYYVIGHTWTERINNGKFEWSNLNLEHVFKDWVTINEDGTL